MQAAQAVSAGDARLPFRVLARSIRHREGSTLRVVILYSSIYQIAAPEDRKILTVADLKGKTIGTQTLTSAAYYSQEWVLKDVASTRTRM